MTTHDDDELDDDELLPRMRAGERRACSVFVRRHASVLRFYFRPRVAGEVEELVLTTFGCLLLSSARPRGTSVRASLFAIAHVVLKQHLRRVSELPAEDSA